MITVLAFGPTASGTVGMGKALDLMTISIGFSNSMGLTGSVSFWSSVKVACWLIVALAISVKDVLRDCSASGITDGFGLGDGGVLVASTTFLLVANLRDDRVGRGVGGAEDMTVRSDDGQSQSVNSTWTVRGNCLFTRLLTWERGSLAGPALPAYRQRAYISPNQ